MPEITDAPPAWLNTELDTLRSSLNAQIPRKKSGANANILIATWNLRGFASVTRKWLSSDSDSPKRDLAGLLYIATIIQSFDVIAIQELKGNLRALRDILNFLGKDWSFLMTDITVGDQGNGERMAFIFDRRRVQPSGLAAEIVIPPEWLDNEASLNAQSLKTQFARTPYAVSFKAGDQTFILVTLHVLYGDEADRVLELAALARWMQNWASKSHRWHHNLLTLGDFNTDRRGDTLWEAFTSTGLEAPPELNSVRRTLFSTPGDTQSDKFYDQIAWFMDSRHKARLSMEYVSGGGFDFLPFVYTQVDPALSKTSVSWRVSDHYPLWVEFKR